MKITNEEKEYDWITGFPTGPSVQRPVIFPWEFISLFFQWSDHMREIQKLDEELVELHDELETLKKEKSRIFAALKGQSYMFQSQRYSLYNM